MEKLNIAEILRDCPKGMELDCTICNGVKFIELSRNPNFAIVVRANNGYEFSLTKYGQVHNMDDAKCIIFPKGKTTWEGFQGPFKDGDILIGKSGEPFIFKRLNNSKGCYSYCGIDLFGQFKLESDDWTFANSLRFATEEEKQKLFDAIKADGYKWNAETKTLEKLIVPKFKVGDKIVKRNSISHSWIVSFVSSEYYGLKLPKGSEAIGVLPVSEQDDYELLPNKFDITTLKPFESKILVRNVGAWEPAFFGYYSKEYAHPFVVVGGNTFAQCVPYEENKHLLGTTKDCDDFYKTW